MKLVNKETKYICKPYHDREVITDYEFDTEITEKQFREYLKESGVKEPVTNNDPWSDYVVITGYGKEWTYKEVSPFTD